MTKVRCLKNDSWHLLESNINAFIATENAKLEREIDIKDIKISVVTNTGQGQNFFYVAMIMYF